MATMLVHTQEVPFMNAASSCLHALSKNSNNAQSLAKAGGVEVAMRMLYWHPHVRWRGAWGRGGARLG